MSWCSPVARPLALRLAAPERLFLALPLRTLTTDTTTTTTTATTTPPPPPPETEAQSQTTTPTPSAQSLAFFETFPETAIRPWAESRLLRQGTPPVGSRRRRVALRERANVPFELLPYQCFQEARKILREDREEKLAKIHKELRRIEHVEKCPVAEVPGGTEERRQKKLVDMRKYVEDLKIWADINDPAVLRKFQDGVGDMDKPIYRHLAKQKWEKYRKLETQQRIEQFHIVPDLLPGLTVEADAQLFYRQRRVEPGTILPSVVTEHPPTLRVQVFNPGPRLVTIAIVDADVPDPENNTFFNRLHFVAHNVELTPNDGNLALSRLPDDNIAVPWLPAFAQLGSPYHRMAIVLMDQPSSKPIRTEKTRERYERGRDRFNLTSFNAQYRLSPFGFTMFRTVWDDNTEAVMARSHIPGADQLYKPMRYASLKPPPKVRGWEARRQGAKFKFLWKYTKRIRGLSSSKKWSKLK